MDLMSTGFTSGADMPQQYTCEGADLAPPLSWSGVPNGTRSLALIVDDPDAPDPAAPKMTWVHWVLFDIPPSATAISPMRWKANCRLPSATPPSKPQVHT